MGEQHITVRRMDFEVPETLDPLTVRGEPEESFMLLGLSLLLPYLEPYLIRSMKVARERIQSPELLAELKRFCAQEGQHFREHKRFNRAMQGRQYPGLGKLEAELARDYEAFTADKSLRFNLAYAEGFEAMTAATALFLLETRHEREMHPLVEQLMFWHALEELEHRTVAFDVYQHIYGGYLYRLAVGLFAQAHLLRFAVRVTRYMLRTDHQCIERHGGAPGRRRRLWRQTSRLVRTFLPKILRSYSPWYSPKKIVFTPEMEAMARDFTARARSVS